MKTAEFVRFSFTNVRRPIQAADVEVAKDDQRFALRVERATPEQLVEVLRDLSVPVTRLVARDAGALAAHLVTQLAKYEVRLLHEADESGDYYSVQILPRMVRVVYRSKGRVEYDGTADALRHFEASTRFDPATLVGKVVRFYYQGGTRAGNRVVKVESVEPARGNGWIIRGSDLYQDEPRCYRSEQIRGDVVIID